jgi:mRNA interferase MazF
MAEVIARGEIRFLDLPKPDRRRPVLVLTRPALLQVLDTVTVVAITSTLRGVPTEVSLGPEEGLKGVSCANLTNIFTVRRSQLGRFVGQSGAMKMREVCRALNIACGCD